MCKKTVPDAITVFVVLFAIVTIVAEIVILSKIESFDVMDKCKAKIFGNPCVYWLSIDSKILNKFF